MALTRAAALAIAFLCFASTARSQAVDQKTTQLASPANRSEDARVEEEVRQRSRRIDSEVAALEKSPPKDGEWGKEWAGSYYNFMGEMIKIAPTAGFTYTEHGCLGMYDAAFGEVERADAEGLTLKYIRYPKSRLRGFGCRKLYFIRWGSRRYLVPETQVEEFISEYSAGGMTRRQMMSIPRKDDSKIANGIFEPEPDASPELPAAFAGRLKCERIELTLTGVGEPHPSDSHPDSFYLDVHLDKGAANGIRKDDVLTYRRGKSHGIIIIDKLEDSTCSGKMFYFRNKEPENNMPESGQKLSHWVLSSRVKQPAEPPKVP